ncbi:MAG: DUF2834 domain-containing protein [Gammaproteobacteria bacterium]|nr:DUF2834 domain-containing protein [Gammaproteobacteria bacterium]
MKKFYIVFCVLGVALPYWQFLPWLIDHGIDPVLLFQEAAQLRIGAFAWLDVIVSAIVLLQFIFYEGRQLKIQRLWMPTVGTLTVGVSLGLPLFLLLREIHIEKQAANSGG